MSCAEGASGGAAVEDFYAGRAGQRVVQGFGRAASFHVGDDTGVEGDGAAGAYGGAPLSFSKPEVVGDLCAGFGIVHVQEQYAA